MASCPTFVSEEHSDQFDLSTHRLSTPDLSALSSAGAAARHCRSNGTRDAESEDQGPHEVRAQAASTTGQGVSCGSVLESGEVADAGKSEAMGNGAARTGVGEEQGGEEEEHVCDWSDWVCHVCGKTPFVWR